MGHALNGKVRGDRVVLVGFGAIGRAVMRSLAERGGASCIAAIALRDASRPRPDVPAGLPLLTEPAQLDGIDAALVVEMAGRDSVAPWGRAALARGMRFAVSSTSAFADLALLDELTDLAQRHHGQLVIPPGALGGIDALSAAARMGIDWVEHRITKPPGAWAGTAAEALCNLDGLRAATDFFSGSARDAAAGFPQNANVALICALAGIGPDRTRVTLTADPGASGNTHEITAQGAFGRMALQFQNAPLPDNPKSSAMTALSLVRLIENARAPLVI